MSFALGHEIVEMPDRGHALRVDSGWRQVADTALAFVKRFVSRAS
jgi:non-heme chloroperoxidase